MSLANYDVPNWLQLLSLVLTLIALALAWWAPFGRDRP
jgi:hypothetical protein